MAFDQVLDLIGKMGKWQAIILLIVAYPGFILSWQVLVITFLTPELDYFCQPEVTEDGGVLEGADFATWKAALDPALKAINEGKPENETLKLSQCNATTFDPVDGMIKIGNESCSRWVYDKSFYQETLVTEFDLVCSHDWLITVSQSVYMLGILVGVVVSGIVSDNFGRKYTIMASAVFLVIFGCAAAYANSFVLFIVLRFFIAFCSISCFTTAYVYCLEMVGGVWSVIVGIGLEFPWAFGYSILPLLAYYVPEWSWLHLAISLPILLFLPITCILPESPRWLLSQGRLDEAEDVLDRAVEINGGKWQDGLKLVKTAPDVSANFIDLFRTPNMRKKTLIQWFLWFTCSFVYYGLTLNTGTLIPGGDLHINFMVSGLIEFPAYALTIIVLLFFGRRVPLSGMLFLTGVCYAIVACTPEDYATTLLVVASIGKFGVTAAFAVIYLYAAELFPTVLRQTGLGSSSMCARIGSVLAPPVGRQLGRVNRLIPIVIFAAVSLLGGIATLALPETRGGVLPDSVEEGEEFGKGQRICDCDMGSSKSRDDNRRARAGVDNIAYT